MPAGSRLTSPVRRLSSRPVKAAWIALCTATLALGLVVGVVIGLAVDDDGDAGGPEVSCADARAEVNEALDAMEGIDLGESASRSDYAAMVSEQRSVTFVMDAAPECFTLGERADAEGLLDALRTFLSSSG